MSITSPIFRGEAMDNDLAEAVKAELQRIGSSVDKGLGASKTRIEQLQARVAELEQRAVRPRGGSGGDNIGSGGRSIGAMVEAAFTDGDARDLMRKTGRVSFDVQASITTTQTGGSHGNLAVPTAPAQPGSSLISLLTPGDLAGMSTLHYARRTSVSGAAAAQDAEGAAKATAEPVFTAVTQNTITVAGLATLSEQALNAAGGLERAVNSHLRKAVADACDAILIAGTTATQWPFAGFQALASTLTAGVGYKSIVDAVIVAATRMRLQGFNPTIAVLAEAGFLATQLDKGTDGHYLAASDMLGAAGLRLAISSGITAGKALLIDPQFVGYLSDGNTRVTLGTINDQFSKNLVTAKCETALAPFASDYQGLLLITPSAT
jgi:HK97 family phage major capsid protein